MSEKAKADVLITGDKVLLAMERFGRTRILSARDFTKEFLE
ncbi:MAG: hypothetical protein WBO28_01545 [Flavobacteriales bacterium]|jgi:predicted nucleic acid-binding protein